MRLDIVTNDAGENVRREHARELGSGVVVAIYRLAKLAQMHDLGNQAFMRQLEQTHQMIGDYGLRSGSNVSILFVDKVTFVAGQLLKGNRGAYEASAELGQLFERLGGSEVHVAREITREDLRAFAEQVSVMHRSGSASQARMPKSIAIRQVAANASHRGIDLEDLTPDERITRAYASAVVIMRRFFEDLSESRYVLPRRIKRIAQSLVDLSDASSAAYLGVTEARNANFDEAGRAVNTAILAVSIARETTSNRIALAQIAMAAMMHDVSRPRALALAGAQGGPMPGMAGPSTLSEDQEDRLAAGAAAVLTALGRVNEPSITRTVLTFESLWLRRRTWLGPVYWGARPPTLQATIIAVARRYNDLLTPEPGLETPTTDNAVAILATELTDPQDRTVLRMLVSAMGLLPVGTIVQLHTGEIAEVTRGARGLGDKPRVMLLADANNNQYAQPMELEVAQDPRRNVLRVLAIDGWSKGLQNSLQTDDSPHGPDSDNDIDVDQGGIDSGNDAAPYAGTNDSQDIPMLEPEPEPEAPPTVTPPRMTAADQQAGFTSEHPESENLPSMGSSPSAVAEAMGRMINDSLAPPSMAPREQDRPDRTVFQPQGAAGLEPQHHVSTQVEREPTARGNLSATPIPHVLVYMLDHGLTGSVVFEGTGVSTGSPDDTLYFVNGVPAKIKLGDQIALLGEVLIEDGSLDAPSVEHAVQGAQRMQLLLGEFLVGHDLVTREALAWALEGQLLRKLAHVANLAPEIEYSFYRDVDLLSDWGGEINVTHPLNPILASVRHWTDRSRVRATLNRIGKHPLVIHADSDLGNLAATPEEQIVLDAVRGEPMPLHEVFKRRLADDETVSSLVYTLAVTRQFSFKGQKKGPMAARGAAWRGVTAPPSASASAMPPAASSSGPGSQSSGSMVSGARAAASAPPQQKQAAVASAAAGGTMPVPADPIIAPPPQKAAPKIGPPSAQMRAAAPAASSSGAAAAPPPKLAPPQSQRSIPAIRPVIAKKPTMTGLQASVPPDVRPPPPSQRKMAAAVPLRTDAVETVPPSARASIGPQNDDQKTMIASASPAQIKELMNKRGGIAPPPASGAIPPPPANPMKRSNPGLPPKPSMPNRPSLGGIPASAAPNRPSLGGMPAVAPATPTPNPVRATGANPPRTTSKAPHTMKGVAPAPPENDSTEVADIDPGLADAEAALDAMGHFQDAEDALAKNDLARAEDLVMKALRGDPTEPNYKGLAAYIKAQRQPAALDDAIRSLSKVLLDDPANERALLFRSRLLTRKNRLPEAMNDLEELLSSNPNHAEAKREAQTLRAKIPG